MEAYNWKENITKKISEDKNSKLFMTSFNLDPTLALTKEGIKSQFIVERSVSVQMKD